MPDKTAPPAVMTSDIAPHIKLGQGGVYIGDGKAAAAFVVEVTGQMLTLVVFHAVGSFHLSGVPADQFIPN